MRGPDLRWNVDLFNDLESPEFGTWFDLELRVEISPSGIPVVRELAIRPKLEMSWPVDEGESVLEPLTKGLLRQVVRRFDTYARQAEAAAVDTGAVDDATEFEVARLEDGSYVRLKGGQYFTVAPDGSRRDLEPDELERYHLVRLLSDPDQRRRVSRQKVTDERLKAVAEVYKQAKRRGRSTNRAIQDHFHLSRAMADKLISQSRDAGYLAKSRGGQRESR